MARIRTIKPEFFTSEDIVELEPMARLLYIALWCEADREGRMAWKPRTFKMRYLPIDDCDIDALCNALVARGLVCLYGDGLAYIPSFNSHQHVNPREAKSSFPEPNGDYRQISTRDDASVTRDDASNLDLHAHVGKERKGKESYIGGRVDDASAPCHEPERKSRKKPRQQIADSFKFSDRVRAYGAKLNFASAEIDREEQRFIRYAKQNARICADWDMAAENWLDKAAEFAGKPSPIDTAKAAEAAAALEAMFYAKPESPQLDAWDSHYRAVSNKSAPRDRNGGWYFKTEWPPGYHPQKLVQAPEPPRLKSMGDLH